MVAEHLILRFKLESQKLGNDGLDSFLHRDAAVKKRPNITGFMRASSCIYRSDCKNIKSKGLRSRAPHCVGLIPETLRHEGQHPDRN